MDTSSSTGPDAKVTGVGLDAAEVIMGATGVSTDVGTGSDTGAAVVCTGLSRDAASKGEGVGTDGAGASTGRHPDR